MSVEALKKAEETQLKNIEASTGKKAEEWAAILKASGYAKHGELVNFLKKEHGLGHGNANMLVHFANKSHSGFENNDELITQQYYGKETLYAIYQQLIKDVMLFGNDVEISAKKAYVSLRRKKQFAIIQPSTKTRLDIGLNLKNVEASGALEQAGSWNTMCSHRIKVENTSDLNAAAIDWLRMAYEQA